MFNADKIRELRLKSNLSTVELSQKILVSQPAITKWENKRMLPNAENLEALAIFFKVPIDEFFINNKPANLA